MKRSMGQKLFLPCALFLSLLILASPVAAFEDDEGCLLCHKYPKMGRITEDGARRSYYVMPTFSEIPCTVMCLARIVILTSSNYPTAKSRKGLHVILNVIQSKTRLQARISVTNLSTRNINRVHTTGPSWHQGMTRTNPIVLLVTATLFMIPKRSGHLNVLPTVV